MSPTHVPSASATVPFRERRILPEQNNEQLERRQHLRYPIAVNAHYSLAKYIEHTTTLDMSSGGVFLRTGTTLPVGHAIQISIDWPALLDHRCPLQLVIKGKVLRSNPSGTAVTIRGYEFRLRPTATLSDCSSRKPPKWISV